jgi:hypothetical protein
VARQGRGPARATGAVPGGFERGTTRATPAGAGRCSPRQGVAGAAARVDLAVAAAAARVRCEREREVGERNVRPRYYTCLCSSG